MNFNEFYENSSNLDLIKETEICSEIKQEIGQIDETLSFMNALFKVVGSQKRSIYPDKYMSYVIGSKGFSNLLDTFSDSVLRTRDGKPSKTKIFVKGIFQGVPPNVNKLTSMQVNTAIGGMFKKVDTINFFEPVEKINHTSLYTTNLGASLNQGDIVLWDVKTKDDFDDIENVDELKELGWEEGSNQFILSVSKKGYKYWTQLTGMTIEAWVKKSRIGNVTDPYFGIKDDVMKASKPKRPDLVISKELYNKLIPESTTVESVILDEKVAERKIYVDGKGKEMRLKKFARLSSSKVKTPSIKPDDLRIGDVGVDENGEADSKVQNLINSLIEKRDGIRRVTLDSKGIWKLFNYGSFISGKKVSQFIGVPDQKLLDTDKGVDENGNLNDNIQQKIVQKIKEQGSPEEVKDDEKTPEANAEETPTDSKDTEETPKTDDEKTPESNSEETPETSEETPKVSDDTEVDRKKELTQKLMSPDTTPEEKEKLQKELDGLDSVNAEETPETSDKAEETPKASDDKTPATTTSNSVMNPIKGDIKGFDKLAPKSTDKTDGGYVYNFNNGGKFFVYTVRNAKPEDKYKIAWDTKAKNIISKIPEIKKEMNRQSAVE